MNKKLALLLAAGALVVGAQQSAAISISGEITFKGEFTLDDPAADGADFDDATKVTTWSNTSVGSATGDLASVASGSAVTFTAPWSFNSGAHANLWSVGGFTFDLSSSSIAFQNSSFLSVSGTGVLKKAGFDDTIGTFNFSTQEPDAAGSFTFSAATSVPDGGTTAMLLGVGVLGLAGLRRKLS